MLFNSSDYQLQITPQVIKTLSEHIQDSPRKKESGGILLGEIIGNKIIISKISTPNSFDIQTRVSFTRSRQAAELIIKYEAINSNGRLRYLGEWHTHPEDYPKITNQDIIMIRTQVGLNPFKESPIVTIIQGIKDLYVALYMESKLIPLSKADPSIEMSEHY